MTEHDPATLAADLYATYADTDDAHRAATDVVIRAVGGKWVRDGGFVSRCVERNENGQVWIDYQAAAELADNCAASGGEKRMLRLACSLVGRIPEHGSAHMDDWTLGEMLSGLDDANRELALGAITYAAGYHRRPGGTHAPEGLPT
jgi:hypothetical protein